jgi:hypothetical protein
MHVTSFVFSYGNSAGLYIRLVYFLLLNFVNDDTVFLTLKEYIELLLLLPDHVLLNRQSRNIELLNVVRTYEYTSN